MENYEQIERRTFVGEAATTVGDGWAGFHLNQQYELHVTRADDDTVTIMLRDYKYASPGAGLVLTSAQFEKWFRKW